jgi:hypothetical protein
MVINSDSLEQYYKIIVPHSPERIVKAIQLARSLNKPDVWVTDSVLELLYEQEEKLNAIDPLCACYESIFWVFWEEIRNLTGVDIQDLDGKYIHFDEIKTPFGCDKTYKNSLEEVLKTYKIELKMLSDESAYLLKEIGIEIE